jgi:predicted translin family RNA/ssDNA-binding protein
MEKSTLEIKEEFLRKLEDIKNSCESLVEKVGHLQVDLFNHPDKELEKALDKLNNDFSNDHMFISELCENYENVVAQLKK